LTIVEFNVKDSIKISVIIPIYNGEPYIKRCFDILNKQNFYEPWEIIIVDDASTDKSKELIKKYRLPNLKLYSLPTNSGQSVARNLGLTKASGEYIFFQDIDDLISVKSLKTLYKSAKENNCDMVCSDFKRIEKSDNQRAGTYNYQSDMVFNYEDITKSMLRELHNVTESGHLGLFGCNGRLIRRSIIIENKVFFDEKMRLLEDKIFGWNLLSFCHKAIYLREQLYSYYVYPDVNTATTDGLDYGFGLKTVKLMLEHIKNSLERRNLPKNEVEKCCEHGIIFFSIHILISITRPLFLGKIDFNKGKKIRRDVINEMLRDDEISRAIKNYIPSKRESSLIPKAIAWKSRLFLEVACNRRAKESLKIRRAGDA
jgi:glycosyltransferase involved in cell wall biosynthesis